MFLLDLCPPTGESYLLALFASHPLQNHPHTTPVHLLLLSPYYLPPSPFPIFRGGTIIQSWMDNSTNAKCKMSGSNAAASPAELFEAPLAFADPTYNASAGPNPNTGFGVLYNAMINPFTVGPMSISSFIWFQVRGSVAL